MTIKEIAQNTGVSVATVSNIINQKGRVSEETKERVEAYIREHNYTPNAVAKNLKMQRSHSIGVIAEDVSVFVQPDIIDGITECCEEEGFQVFLVNLRLYKKYGDKYYKNDDHKELVHKEIQKLIALQVEGIIYIAAHERSNAVIPEGLPIPVVMAYSFTNNPQIPSVVVDDRDGARQLMDYLIAKGHRKIGVITGKKESFHAQRRLEGYQSALFDHEMIVDPSLVRYGDWERDSGYRYTKELIEKGVTAIFCMNDVMAGGAYDQIEEMGLTVGEDIAVVGYDNQALASFEKPPLTTVALPLHDIGYQACGIILQMLSGRPLDNKEGLYRISCSLCERSSVNEIKPEG
jgi:LacI family transcriptional regulator